MPIQQKLTPPVLLFSDFAGWQTMMYPIYVTLLLVFGYFLYVQVDVVLEDNEAEKVGNESEKSESETLEVENEIEKTENDVELEITIEQWMMVLQLV